MHDLQSISKYFISLSLTFSEKMRLKYVIQNYCAIGESPNPLKIVSLKYLKNYLFKLNHLALNPILNDSPPNSNGFMSLSIIVSEKSCSIHTDSLLCKIINI